MGPFVESAIREVKAELNATFVLASEHRESGERVLFRSSSIQDVRRLRVARSQNFRQYTFLPFLSGSEEILGDGLSLAVRALREEACWRGQTLNEKAPVAYFRQGLREVILQIVLGLFLLCRPSVLCHPKTRNHR